MKFGIFEIGFVYMVIFTLYWLTLARIQKGAYVDALKLGLVLVVGSFMMHSVLGEKMAVFFSIGNHGFSILALITSIYLLSFSYDGIRCGYLKYKRT